MHGSSLDRCLSLDLEVGKEDGRIRALAGVREDTGDKLVFSGGRLTEALAGLDELAEGASCVLGHNLIAFDLPHLAAVEPELRLLRLPAVDTLRLSPLAFPRNPYHHLVKHYQDGGLRRGQRNDPELDARLALEVFEEQRQALRDAAPDLLAAWHRLSTPDPAGGDRAFDDLFAELRGARRPSDAEARTAIDRRLAGIACATHGREVTASAGDFGWALAYALAWLSVAGGNSVMPSWVRHQFPEAGNLVRRLRDTACHDPACDWCRERQDARRELERWFGFDDFRPEPQDDEGRPMQQSIVEAAMAGEHLLGILPTGTGKSLCYQIPALSRYDKTGALTVVISPLVALMADQVAGLEARGVGACVTINGLLSVPERADALDQVRMGDAGILIISPEQLRARAVRGVIAQREIGAWVLDEAHCLSRWGHDFRPDYRYVGRFIRERAGDDPVPPVLCLTATAKPDVTEDIVRHFRDRLDIGLTVFDGGAERSNLTFEVIPTSPGAKFSDVHQVLMSYLPQDVPGGAIVYCATRRQSEEVAEFLQLKGIEAEHFHAGLPPETKKDVQRRFIGGELRAIAATNAFGMGIDKPDVRLVIHADIPGSLENYLQEAGRAGRDRESARCVLLYAADDVERQFFMSARSRLTRVEIHGILRALRNLDRGKRQEGEVVATAGEILAEDEDNAFERDSATDDTRVRTAVSWLEEAELLTREENAVQVFPSSLRVSSVEEARAKLAKASLAETRRRELLRIARALIEADADEGVSTDELMNASGLSPEGVRGALYDLERLGIASNDTVLTAFVHAGVERASLKRLEEASVLETALIDHMREAAPDMGKGDRSSLHLRIASQTLREEGLANPLPERLWRILRSIAWDGRGEDGAAGSLTVRKQDAETVRVTLQREWRDLAKTARLRREAAGRLLDHLLACLPSGSRGTDLLAETTLGKLTQAMESDILLKSNKVRNPARLLDRALLWLHEQEVIRLHKGLTVFRPAMTIRLVQRDRRGFAKTDFEPLALHYKGQVLQIHVMVEFAQRGLDAMSEALRLAMDYFTLREEEFLRRWLPGRDREIGRETTPESWRAIVENLKNPIQQRIVADDREQTNVLVLAGPGSGKTRVLVHRIAWLVRARRENARGILALAYNRHAAVDIRRRLDDLIGRDARGVTVLTCHALAMRLVGVSFAERADAGAVHSGTRGGARGRGRRGSPDDELFRQVMKDATKLLRGEGLPPGEADAQRERLLAGFRWILVDEYQDIGEDQYELISALAGRTLDDEAGKLTLFAVGDDDQNIYAFNGASVEFIRRFEADYGPRPIHLTDNYRSTGHIVAAANAHIEPARERMKAGYPIRVNRARKQEPPGGSWRKLDPVSQGRVQILPSRPDPIMQAQTAMAELLRLAALSPDWDWSGCAVIAREWSYLEPVRAWCEAEGVPVQMANEETPAFWRLRETGALREWLLGRESGTADGAALRAWLADRPAGPWIDLLREAVDEYALESGEAETPVKHFVEWLAEWGREVRRRQRGLLLLSAHRAKGLEFDHVAVLDGNWDKVDRGEDEDAPRRLYYVAMTRARRTLVLMRFQRGPYPPRSAPYPPRSAPASNHVGEQALPAYLSGSPPPAHPRETPPPPASLADSPAVLHRAAGEPPTRNPALDVRYRRLGPGDVYLSFAGWRDAGHSIHRAIAALSPGDPLKVRDLSGRRELLDRHAKVVGRLAAGFEPPPGMQCRSATVLAILSWHREDSEPEYRDRIRCDSWEVVVPELVFEPAGKERAGGGIKK